MLSENGLRIEYWQIGFNNTNIPNKHLTLYFMMTHFGAFEIPMYVYENIMENRTFVPLEQILRLP